MLGGVQKTTDFLDKSTWTLAAALIVLILLSSLSFPGMGGGQTESKVIEQTETAAPKTATETPAATPAQPTGEKK
jgi:preprotein translocase subunit SecG